MAEMLTLEFMRHALIGGFFIAIMTGIVGSLIVVNRMVFVAGGIAHSAYGGIGLAIYFGLPVFIGALGFSLLSALLIAYLSLHDKHRTDTHIGLVWAVGMAIGVIAVDLTPGYHPDMSEYLFGSILAVSKNDLWIMGAVCFLTILIVSLRYKQLLFTSYDSEYAQLQGINTTFYRTLLLLLSAFSTVIAIKMVGLILVIALLTIPIYIAERISATLWSMMWIASLIAVILIVSGLTLSYFFDLSSGAIIILLSAVFMIVFRLAHHFLLRVLRAN